MNFPSVSRTRDNVRFRSACAPKRKSLGAHPTWLPRLANAPEKHKTKGFTLLEMLVVLVITALLGTLLLYGITHVLQIRGRLLEHLHAGQRGMLPEHWFRSTVQGLIPDYPPTAHPDFFQAAEPKVFYGKPRTLGGLTLAALDGAGGVPLPFVWKLTESAGRTRLEYENSRGEIWPVLEWEGDAGRFEYLDPERKRHPEWPPKLGEAQAQLPAAVLCYGRTRRGQVFVWLSVIAGRKDPNTDYRLTY